MSGPTAFVESDMLRCDRGHVRVTVASDGTFQLRNSAGALVRTATSFEGNVTFRDVEMTPGTWQVTDGISSSYFVVQPFAGAQDTDPSTILTTTASQFDEVFPEEVSVTGGKLYYLPPVTYDGERAQKCSGGSLPTSIRIPVSTAPYYLTFVLNFSAINMTSPIWHQAVLAITSAGVGSISTSHADTAFDNSAGSLGAQVIVMLLHRDAFANVQARGVLAVVAGEDPADGSCAARSAVNVQVTASEG